MDAVLNKLHNYLSGILREKAKAKIIILGLGNLLKQDDAFGSLLAKRLIEKNLKRFSVFDLEDVPQNYLGKMIKEAPDFVLLVDAVSFNAAPGDIRIFTPDELVTKGVFFTHNASIGFMMNFLKENTDAPVMLLGVQPKQMDFGEGLSEELEKALNRLEDWIENEDSL
ncbi:MAG: hydrogenase 3 maturation endopeptidase HyCI [Candidatus Omnitrophota bacterium]